MHSRSSPAGRSATVEKSDLRAHPRFFISVEVEVSSRAGRQRALLKDISLGGARMLVGYPVGAWGDTAKVELNKEGASLDLEGAVVRTEPQADGYCVAVRFLPFAPNLKAQLESVIARLEEQARA